MPTIDPVTLVIVNMLMAILLAVIMLNMRTSFPRTIHGIDQWAVATVLAIVAAGLFTRQQMPRFFHVMLANGCMILAMIYMGSGLLRMFRLPMPRRWPVVAGFIVVMGLMGWFTYFQPLFQARLLIMTLLGLGAFSYLASLPLRQGRHSVGSWVTVFAFGLTALSCGVRLVSLITHIDDPARLFDDGNLQVLYLATFNITLLIATVGFILMANEQLRSILEFNAAHDALTGVLNRSAFFGRAQADFEHSKRTGRPLSLALIDLDHFKKINDEYGHAMGDRVLVDFCTTVRAALREGDYLGRYGGEEFVLLLPDTSHQAAVAVMQRLLTNIRSGLGLPAYTFSAGYATLTPEMAELDDLLTAADKALYLAKKNGRARAETIR